MTNQGKTTLSLSVLALLGLTITCDAVADTNREQHRTIRQVNTCVAEIAKHADYDDAARALHVVEQLKQKNLVLLQIRIVTSVYVADGEEAARKYKTSCRVARSGNLIDFRIDEMKLIPGTKSQEIL